MQARECLGQLFIIPRQLATTRHPCIAPLRGLSEKGSLFFLAMIRRGIEELARVQGYAEETPHVMDEVRAAWRCRHGSRAEPIETSRLSPIKPPPMTTDVTPTSHSRKDAHPGARAQGEDAFKPDDRERSSGAA